MTFHRRIPAFFLILLGIGTASSVSFPRGDTLNYNLPEVRKYVDTSSIKIVSSIQSNVHFRVFTRNGTRGELIKPYDLYLLTVSNFNINNPTKVLIHGFFDKANGDTITTIKENFLSVEDVNVIIVDWSNVSMRFNYVGAALRSAEVGHYLSELITFLVSHGTDIKTFHVIGLGIGAHIAGASGRSLRAGKIPRITGLDPALPGFGYPSLFNKLQPSDAEFVDCIHTCGGFLGFLEPLCHVDFYPNGGTHPQPGCPFIDFGKCSHFRSFYLFAESVLDGHRFPVIRCKTITSDSRDCEQLEDDKEVRMGNNANNSTRGLYYVYTNSGYPYAPIRK